MKAIFLSTFFCICATACEAQRYVDFHIHTILKNYYRNIAHPNDALSLQKHDTGNWKIYPSKKPREKFNNIKSVDQATNPVLSSSGASFLCTSLYTLEKQSLSNEALPATGIITNKFWRDIARFSPLRIFDRLFSLRFVNKIAVTGISSKRQGVAFDEQTSNFHELLGQLHYLQHQAVQIDPYRPVQLARTRTDLEDNSKIWLILTVEGAHNFYGNRLSHIDDIKGYRIDKTQEQELLANLAFIKDNYRLLFVTPAHLFENKVAGGARGLDIDKTVFRAILSRLMWDNRFAVVDNKDVEGINHIYRKLTKYTVSDCICTYDPSTPTDTVETGWKFIHQLLEPNKDGKRTFVDLKHMDVKARLQIIDTIQKMNARLEKKIPLIVSHAAVSGKKSFMAALLGLCPNYDDYEEFTPTKVEKFYRHFARTCSDKMGMNENEVSAYLDEAGWFHPMSNNLFDEEIEAVFKSGGIIGITMEERGLGGGGFNYTVNSRTNDRLLTYIAVNAPILDGRPLEDLKQDLLSAEPFVRNLFYIVEHSGMIQTDLANRTIKSWEHIAIGSDFDGIMNPIDICPTAENIPKFYHFLAQYLPYYARYLNKEQLLFNRDPKELLDLVFYKNGERFIKEHF